MRYLAALLIILAILFGHAPAEAKLSTPPEEGKEVGILVACKTEIEGKALLEAVAMGQEAANELLGLGVCGHFNDYVRGILLRALSEKVKTSDGLTFQLWQANIPGDGIFYVLIPWEDGGI